MVTATPMVLITWNSFTTRRWRILMDRCYQMPMSMGELFNRQTKQEYYCGWLTVFVCQRILSTFVASALILAPVRFHAIYIYICCCIYIPLRQRPGGLLQSSHLGGVGLLDAYVSNCSLFIRQVYFLWWPICPLPKRLLLVKLTAPVAGRNLAVARSPCPSQVKIWFRGPLHPTNLFFIHVTCGACQALMKLSNPCLRVLGYPPSLSSLVP